MEEFDVLVVGAGPAGLCAAVELAGKCEVLLVEKEAELARKPCAEAISTEGIADFPVKIPSKVIRNKLTKAVIHMPDPKKTVEIKIGGKKVMIVDKKRMLEALLRDYAKKGGAFSLRSKLKSVRREEDFFVSRVGDESVKSHIVLGCDGYASVVARSFFRRENFRLIGCYQYVLTNCRIDDPSVGHFFFGEKIAPQGYAWIFPWDEETACVGLGSLKGHSKERLDKFVEGRPELERAVPMREGGAAVPVSGQVEKVVGDGVMICGDAAGQVIPVTGGGNHAAILAGSIAGKVAARAIEEGDLSERFLSAYPRGFEERYGWRIRKSLKVQKALLRLKDEDFNMLADVLTGEDVWNLANGIKVREIALRLLKHPRLAARIAKLLL